MIYIKIGKRKDDVAQVLYDIALLTWTLSVIVFNYTTVGEALGIDLSSYIYYINIITVFTLLIKMLFLTKYSITNLLVSALLLLITGINYYRSDSIVYFILAIFLAASKNVNQYITFKKMYRANLILLGVLCSLAFTGIIPNRIMGIESERMSLGFLHPNNYGAIMISTVFLIFYCNWRRLSIYHWLAIVALLAIDLIFPKSKTAILIVLLMLMLYFYINLSQNSAIYRITIKIIKYVPIAIVVSPLLLVQMYLNGNSLALMLNKVLSTRIYQLSYFWENYHITLLGQHLTMISSYEANSLNAMHTLDNSYLNILLGGGVIIFLILIGLLIYLVTESFKCGNYKTACIFICIFFWGFMETSIYKLEFNTIILLIAIVLYKNKSLRKDGESKHG